MDEFIEKQMKIVHILMVKILLLFGKIMDFIDDEIGAKDRMILCILHI
jgi:hypothetical protein